MIRVLVGAAAGVLGMVLLAGAAELEDDLADPDRSTVGQRTRYFARRSYIRGLCGGWVLFWSGLALFTTGLLQLADC